MADSASDLPRLSVLTGSLAGQELVLEEVVDNILIGADPSCRFHIPLPGISPIHARIWMDAAGVTVYDTHSPRGLYVNDDRVSGQAPLRNGDILWLGTPGEEEAVMIQCRLPQRGATAAAVPAEPPASVAPVAAAASPEPEPDADSTIVMGAAPVVAEPEALEVVEDAAPAAAPEPELPNDLEAIEDSPADATLVMAAQDVSVEEAGDATVVMASSPEPDADATVVGDANAFYIQDEPASEPLAPVPPPAAEARDAEPDPMQFAVEAPPLPVPPPLEPVSFEDETQEPPTVIQAAAEPEPVAPPPPPTPVPVRAPAPTPVPVAAPAPKPARPAAPAPRPPAPAPPAPARSAGGGGGGLPMALLGVGALVILGGGFAAWRFLQSPSTTSSTPPTTVATATVPTTVPATLAPAPPPTAPAETLAPEPVEEVVTIVKSPPPTPAPGATPTPAARPTPSPRATTAPPTPAPVSAEAVRAQQTAAQVSTLLGQADSAAAARNFEGAAGLYEDVLKLDPQNSRAAEGRTAAQNAAFSLRKGFASGKTTVKSEKTAKSPAGFDTEDVSVAKGLDYSGRIDFEANPRNVKPGDSYNVLVYLTNDGKKSFKVSSVSVTTTVNGAKSGGAAPAKVKELEPQQRVLLTELPGTWQGAVSNWSVEVIVQSARGDTLRNVLTWR